MAAYADKVNAEGGINGRKINLITYDDAYNPNKTMEMTRKLVEEDNVLITMATLGTNTNAAIHPYLNTKKIPQLFAASGAATWDQPREFPWTMGYLPSYKTEAHIYAHYILENHPRSKIAVLYQDDGMGKEYLKGLKDGLAGKMPIVAEATYETHGHHHRPPDRQAQGLGRRHLHPIHHAEIRHHGDQAKRRNRLEAAAFHPHDRQFILGRHEPGGSAKRRRHHVGAIPARGRRRGGRRPGGVPRMERLHAAIRPERQQGQRPGPSTAISSARR